MLILISYKDVNELIIHIRIIAHYQQTKLSRAPPSISVTGVSLLMKCFSKLKIHFNVKSIIIKVIWINESLYDLSMDKGSYVFFFFFWFCFANDFSGISLSWHELMEFTSGSKILWHEPDKCKYEFPKIHDCISTLHQGSLKIGYHTIFTVK